MIVRNLRRYVKIAKYAGLYGNEKETNIRHC